MSVDWEKFDYANDLQFSFDTLELDAQDHASLAMKYAEEKTRISKSAKLAKETISIVKSRIIREIIQNATGKKPTVAEIDAEVNQHPEYQEAVAAHIELEYEFELLKDACNSLRDRKEMIQETIKLLQMNYFNRVSLTNGYRKAQEDTSEAVVSNSRETVNRRRRERKKQS